jgi:hypothetical protein
VVRSANGVGSRFWATTNHMEDALPENDSRPLPQNATMAGCVRERAGEGGVSAACLAPIGNRHGGGFDRPGGSVRIVVESDFVERDRLETDRVAERGVRP